MEFELEKRWLGEERKRPHDVRTEYERDRARLIHSAAFRRLQAKTQVLGIGEGDFHRTRLTHTMEVAQIARGLVQQLRSPECILQEEQVNALPTESLIEAISFAHDLGHPPFGHGGEIALNYMMREGGGFEGNGQSLRLLSRLEPYTESHGLNATRRTLLGILKYPRPYSEVRRGVMPDDVAHLPQVRAKPWKPPKCFLDSEVEVVEWLLEPFSVSDREKFRELKREPTPDADGKTKRKSLDASIMELADDIAYGTHDLEDGVALGLIGRDDIQQLAEFMDPVWGEDVALSVPKLVKDLVARTATPLSRKRTAGGLVHAFVSGVRVEADDDMEAPILKYSCTLIDPARRFLKALQDLTWLRIIKRPEVQTLEYRGRLIVMELFRALEAEPESLLTGTFLEAYSSAPDERRRSRPVCDYVAGMTDSYATRLYERLYVPRHGSVFEKL